MKFHRAVSFDHDHSRAANTLRKRGSGRALRVLPVLAAALFATCLAPVRGADICFQRVVSVSTSTVRLKDVAIVSASDPALMTRLENTVLAPAPAPGRRMRLEFAEIRSRLEATGVSPAELNYSGSSLVVVSSDDVSPRVTRPAVKPAKARVVGAPAQVKRAEQLVVEAVRRSMRAKHKETPTMFIDVVVDPADAPSVLANAAQGLEIGNVNQKATEPQVVQVSCQNSQGQPARFQVQCVVSEKPQVPMLTHSVSIGEVIHESDVVWHPVDSTAGLVARLEDLVDREAKKSLHAEEPIHTDDVRNVPLVRNNDIVTGIWRSGGIRITGQFKAKGDGGLGDVITLVKLTGRDQLLARVTDVHEATILSAEQAKPATRGEEGAGNEAPRTVARRALPETNVKTARAAASTEPAAFVEQR